MNTTILRLEVARILRDPVSLFFTALLPAFFYVIFGPTQEYSDQMLPNGAADVAMVIMVAMAAYGAVSATVGIGGRAAVEKSQGWGRQLGLTPLPDATYVAVKVALAVAVAAIPIGLIYLLGWATGADGTGRSWALSAVVLLVGALVFALYGLCFGLAFGSEAAVSAAGGSVVILGFLGNIFFPLSGTLLAIAKWTPLYGYASLARYPLTDGWVVTGGDQAVHEPLWVPLTNVAAWLAILALVATLLVRRSRARQ